MSCTARLMALFAKIRTSLFPYCGVLSMRLGSGCACLNAASLTSSINSSVTFLPLSIFSTPVTLTGFEATAPMTTLAC